MSQQVTIESLKKAFAQSTDNITLLMILIRALYEVGEFHEAYKLIKNKNNLILEENDRLLVSKICENVGDLALSELYSSSSLETVKDSSILKTKSNNVFSDTQTGKRVGLRVVSNNVSLSEEMDLVTFKNIGGLETVKKEIHRKIILPFQKPTLLQKFRKKIGGGVLLYGPPGCGKTLIARATAGECGAKFYNVLISDILDMWLGESEKKLHAVFEQARRTVPSVIFFDELEALASKRQYQAMDATSKLVSQFLSELDGFANNNNGVLILAATNIPWSIDSAFRRPGRFDRVLFVPPPDCEARETILKILLEDRPRENDIDYKTLAQKTSGFSGADIWNVVETACDIAIEKTLDHKNDQQLNMDFLKQAINEVKPTTLEWLSMASNFATYSNENGQYDDVLNFLKKYGK